jgi:hypothetical protein
VKSTRHHQPSRRVRSDVGPPERDVEMPEVPTVDELFARASSQKRLEIRYRLGGGAVRAARDTCADATNTCDCSAYVCWTLGIDKQGSYPYLVPPGHVVEPGNQWYGTDNIWTDAVHLDVGLFQQIGEPAPGCLMVFPTRRSASGKSTPGHIGLVTRVDGTGVKGVLHCSASNFKAFGDAIQETDDAVFRNKPGLIYAWCARIAAPAQASPARRRAATMRARTLSKPVTLYVLAPGAAGRKIRSVAQAVAAENPLGRRVVLRGDADYPNATTIKGWTADGAAPGAAILSPDGSLFKVLGVRRAKRPTTVEKAFAEAAPARGRGRTKRRPRRPQP